MKKKHSKSSIAFLLIALAVISGNLYSQSSSYGNTYIFNTSEIGIIDIQHNFFNGGSGIQPGIVGTDRSDSQGFMSFVGTASWSGVSDSAFVDGYVKTYLTSAFTFPIGDNNKYRPAAISAASLANPANAAYYGVSATTAITSKLSGGNEPVLPAGGPFNTSLMGTGVLSVDNVEYWDINGAASAKITLTWDATSAVTSLSSIGILGWNGTQWVAIASTVDSTSLLGGTSTLSSGSITTNAALVPDTYAIYTLGKVCGSGVAPSLSSTSVANICPTQTVDLNSIVTSSTPSGTSLVWFTNNTHTGTDYTTPATAIAGTYYAFYYDSVNNCYSPGTNAITATIASSPNTPTTSSTSQPNCSLATGTIVITTQTGVEYSINNGTNYQSSPTFAGLTPGNYSLKVRSATSITCSAVGASAVTILNVPSTPTLSATNLINTCPATTVNLNSLVTSGTPAEYSLVWYTNNTHTGTAYATPITATAGTYYAFYYNISHTCYTAATAAISTSLDSDCDGIADLADIDDDNDGIFDMGEQSCSFPTVSKVGATASMTLTAGLGSISNLLNSTDINDFYYATSTIAGQTVAQFNFPTSHIINKLEITTNGSSFFNAGSTVKVQGWDGSAWVDISGILTPATPNTSSFSSYLSVKFDLSNNTNSYIQYRILGVSGGVNTVPWVYEAFFSEIVCTDIDTDSDGVINRLDLDSDGDQCPDAKEAGVTGTLSSGAIFNTSGTTTVTSAIAQGPYGNNGLANALETNDTTAGTTTYASTYSNYAKSFGLNACTDTDGDGVVDLFDIDDDNDGILDAIEAPSCYYTQAEISGISSVTTQLSASAYPTRTMWYDNNATTFSDFNQNLSVANQEIYNITPTTSPLIISAVNFDITNYAILTAGSTAKLQGYDGSNWIDLSAAQTATVTSGIQTFTNTLQPTTAYQKFRIYGVAGTSNYGYCTEIHLIPSALIYGSPAPKATCSVDTDGDGKTNDKDLDSDGDLCPDAKEAGVSGTLLSGSIFNTSGTTSASNTLVQGPFGTNGLANSIETSDTLVATTTYSSTYRYAISNVFNSCSDSDGDGIGDLVDIDDDNDGILDSAEDCNASTATSTPINTAALFTAAPTVMTGDVLIAGTYTPTGITFNSGNSIGLHNGVALIGPFSASIVSGISLSVIVRKDWGIGSYPGTAKGIIEILDSNQSVISSQTWQDGTSTTSTDANNTTISLSATLIGNYYIRIKDNGTTATNGWGDDWSVKELTITKQNCNIDTDGDGIANRLDLDSDYDGCTDAKEAGSTTSNAANYVFSGPYGANGLANSLETGTESGIVNYTLTYANAINNAVKSCVITCPTVTNSALNNLNPSTCTGSNGNIKLCGLASSTAGFTINYSKNGTAATPLTNQTADASGCLLISNLGAGVYSNIVITHAVYCTSGTTAVGPITITAPAGPSIPTTDSISQPTCTVTTGTIVFTTQSGVEYSINDGTSYQTSTTFAGLAAGTYTLKVKSTTDATCATAAASTVTLVAAAPTVAGTISSNQTICSGSAPSDLTLTGNTGNVVKWQKSTDSAFTTPTDIYNTTSTLLGTDIGNLTATTYFRAVVQNGTCSAANTNYVVITINSTTWDGSAWSNGAPIITTTAYMTGNYSEATDIFACTLTVSNNAIVSIPSGYDVTLYGKLTVEAGSSFTLNNNTNLLQQTDVTNTGIVNVKRNTIPMYRLDYNLWSSPVTGTQTLMGFSPLTSNIGPTNIRFYIYNTLTNLYNSVNATSTTFDTAKGYLIRMPNTWVPYSTSATAASWTGTFTGTPRNGLINYTMTNTGDTTRFNAVGNPYPSTLLMNNFINGNSSSIEGTLWFWRKINDNNNLVSYSTCTSIGCTLNNNAIYTDSNFISIGQGFLVKAKTGQTNLTYTNSMRSNANVDQLFKYTSADMDRYWMKLSNSNNLSAGQNLIAYIPEATTAYESGLDGLYLNDSAVAFYSMADTHEVVINARPAFDANDVIQLTFKSNVADTYTFSINQKEGIFNGAQEVLLRDNYNNTIQNLTLGNYSFSTAAGIFTDRFDIIYQNQLSNTNPTLNSNAIIIYNNNLTTFINSGEILMASLKVFDIRGRLLYQDSNINDSKTSIKLNVANQVLLFEITTQNGEIITKKYIK